MNFGRGEGGSDIQRNQPQALEQPAQIRCLRILNWVSLGLGLGLAIAAKLAVSARADAPFSIPVIDPGGDPSVKAYDLGPISLDQQEESGVPSTIPVTLTGLLGLPPGTDPVPLVVLLHGRHRGCHFAAPAPSQWPCPVGQETRFDQGLAYLTDGLTRAGLAVLVPNLNGAFTDTHGAGPENRNRLADQRGQQLIDAHLKRLAIASHGGPNPFSQPLNGRLNWHQLALVGHSMGGGAAALSALNRQDQTSPKQIQQGLGAVAALVLVSPTRSHPLGDYPQAYQLADVPTVVMLGGCDRDILDYSSLYYLETAYRDQFRRTPVLGLMLLGANHNFFNTAIDYDDYYRWPNHASLCDPQRSDQRLSRVIQEQWLQHFLVEFLTMVLPDQGSSGRSGLGLAPDRPAPDRIYDQPVLTNLVWPSRRRYTLFRAGDEASVYQPSPNLQVIPCGAFRPCDGRERSPAFPTVLRLRWRQSDQELVFPLPPKDFRDFSSLQLRLAGVEELPPSSTSAPLGIVLRDRHGGAIRLDLPPTTTALSPLMRDPDTSPFTYPSALRIPLAQFRGVDLATLSSLELRFDGMPQGSLDLAGIEFLSRAEGEW